ncbi:MAG: hypothetical protein KF718_17740 [Polyangiaceae bacterium]|nr:hypothetical protein [Polyangiaceae bacterium]
MRVPDWVVAAGSVALLGACTNEYDDFQFRDDAGGSGTGGAVSAGGGGSGGTGGGDPTGGTGGGSPTGGTGGSGGGAAGNAPGAVHCEGSNDCSLSGNFCCVRSSGSTCQASGSSCVPGLDVMCDGPEDCSGNQVCCHSSTTGGAMACRSASQCSSSLGRSIVCGSTPAACPGGTTCAPLSAGSPYNVCGS